MRNLQDRIHHLSVLSKETRAFLARRDIATWMRALHALSIYDQRVFKPCDPLPEPEEKTEVASVER